MSMEGKSYFEVTLSNSMASFTKKAPKSTIKQTKTTKNILNLILGGKVGTGHPSCKGQYTKLHILTARDGREGVKIILKFLSLNRRQALRKKTKSAFKPRTVVQMT